MPAWCRARHHLLELADLAAGLAAGRVAAVRREERQRIVAPVVRPLAAVWPKQSLIGNSWTGINSTAVTPSDCRYGNLLDHAQVRARMLDAARLARA